MHRMNIPNSNCKQITACLAPAARTAQLPTREHVWEAGRRSEQLFDAITIVIRQRYVDRRTHFLVHFHDTYDNDDGTRMCIGTHILMMRQQVNRCYLPQEIPQHRRNYFTADDVDGNGIAASYYKANDNGSQVWLLFI